MKIMLNINLPNFLRIKANISYFIDPKSVAIRIINKNENILYDAKHYIAILEHFLETNHL